MQSGAHVGEQESAQAEESLAEAEEEGCEGEGGSSGVARGAQQLSKQYGAHS